MDLQKVVVPANSNASQNGGRLETDAGKSASSGLPFVDMIRMPLIGFTDIFANLGNSATSPDTPRDDYRRDDSDEHRPSDEANARKDAPEHTQREDNARAGTTTPPTITSLVKSKTTTRPKMMITRHPMMWPQKQWKTQTQRPRITLMMIALM